MSRRRTQTRMTYALGALGYLIFLVVVAGTDYALYIYKAQPGLGRGYGQLRVVCRGVECLQTDSVSLGSLTARTLSNETLSVIDPSPDTTNLCFWLFLRWRV